MFKMFNRNLRCIEEKILVNKIPNVKFFKKLIISYMLVPRKVLRKSPIEIGLNHNR